MKTVVRGAFVVLVAWVAFVPEGRSQGTLEFTATLSNPNSGAFGSGTFSLSGNFFTYHLFTIFGMTEAEIR